MFIKNFYNFLWKSWPQEAAEAQCQRNEEPQATVCEDVDRFHEIFRKKKGRRKELRV